MQAAWTQEASQTPQADAQVLPALNGMMDRAIGRMMRDIG
jgi:hypothetical protein